jgi:hypothetical protein
LSSSLSRPPSAGQAPSMRPSPTHQSIEAASIIP